jgi:proline iminopeptidase
VTHSALLFLVSALTLAQGRTGAIVAPDGATVRYEEAGAGEPVILLAGGPGFTPTYMKPVCDQLAGSFRCVLLHQRGTGLSTNAAETPDAITLHTFISDIEALRQELRLERVTLVGHSWGGMLAMSYAAAYPDRTQALVLIASGGPTLDFMRQYDRNVQARLTDEDRRTVTDWEEKRKQGADSTMADLAIMKAEMPGSFHDHSKTHLLTDTLDVDAFNTQAFETMIQDLRTTGYDLRIRLLTLRAPVLIVQGTSDPIATAETLHRAIPPARLELIEGAGHYPWLEQPEQFFRVIDDFLERLR